LLFFSSKFKEKIKIKREKMKRNNFRVLNRVKIVEMRSEA